MTEPEITRILVQNRGQESVADHGAVKSIEIGCSRSLSVARGPPSEFGIVVEPFFKARNDKRTTKRNRIDSGAKGHADLFLCSEGHCIVAIGRIECRKDAEHALMLLLLDLLRGLFALRLFGILNDGWRLRA